MKCVTLGFVAGWVVLACSGTETDNPASTDLVSFQSSPCKKLSDVDAAGQNTQALVVASDYDGLRCLEWESSGEASLTLRLMNFDRGCVEQWEGRAEITDAGAIELVLVNPSCMVARCGSCLFDWRFDVRNVPAGVDLPLRVGFLACPSDAAPEWTYDFVIPASSPSGILCSYAEASALGQFASTTDRCGDRFMPCGEASACAETACQAGLECITVDVADQRCLAPCIDDIDCAPSGSAICQESSCQLPSQL